MTTYFFFARILSFTYSLFLKQNLNLELFSSQGSVQDLGAHFMWLQCSITIRLLEFLSRFETTHNFKKSAELISWLYFTPCDPRLSRSKSNMAQKTTGVFGPH